MTIMEIHCDDCVKGMRKIADGSVDVAVTSPPYNLGIAYRSYQDNRERVDYLKWSEIWATEVRRILKADGSFFLNLGAANSDPTLPFEVVLRFSRTMFHLQNTIHWVKSISIPQEDGSTFSKGHFKPINSPRYLNDGHEYVFHFTKSGNVAIDRLAIGVPYADKSNISRWRHTRGGDRRCGGNVWFVPYRTIRSRAGQRPHPATFPVELAERCILMHGREGAVVFDPFLGLGASAEASQRQGVDRFIGFEIDSEYADYAAARVGTSVLRESEILKQTE